MKDNNYIKIIHQIWYNFGNNLPIPDKYKNYQKSWILYHPNWKYILWDEKMGDTFIKQNYPEYYDQYNNVQYPIMKVDLFKYCLLHKIGGMYVDIDYNCLNNFNQYIENNINFDIHINGSPSTNIFKYFYDKSACNSLLISTKKNQELWKILICEAFNRIQNTLINVNQVYYVLHTTGPKLINDVLSAVKNNNLILYNKINILPSDQFNFCDYNLTCHLSTKKQYAYHDYAGTWNPQYWLNLRNLYSFVNVNKYYLLLFLIVVSVVCWKNYN